MSNVENPAHYGGKDNPYEAIKVIEAWGLNFNLGNTVKYIARTGKKDPEKEIEDLEKARWYLDREIANLKSRQKSTEFKELNDAVSIKPITNRTFETRTRNKSRYGYDDGVEEWRPIVRLFDSLQDAAKYHAEISFEGLHPKKKPHSFLFDIRRVGDEKFVTYLGKAVWKLYTQVIEE